MHQLPDMYELPDVHLCHQVSYTLWYYIGNKSAYPLLPGDTTYLVSLEISLFPAAEMCLKND